MIFKNKKAKMELSIVFLVVATLFLVGLSLFVFLIRAEGFQRQVDDYKALEEVYRRVELLDYYLDEIMDNVSEGASNAEFNEELEKYKSDGKYFIKELEDVEDKNFEIVFREDIIKKGEKVGEVIYPYTFEYSK